MEKLKNLKILDKYISKQLVEAFLLGIVIFTSLMFASDTFLSLIKQISLYGIPFNVAIIIVFLKIPSILVMTIPMGVLLSTVMTINKMSLNSEISVMRACGISIARIAKPVLSFAIVAAVGCFFLNEAIVPMANAQAKKLTIWALGQKNIPNGKKNFFFKEMKSGHQLKRLVYVNETSQNQLKGVTILDLSKENTVQVIQAKYGTTKPEYWAFNQGAMYTISNQSKVLNTTLFDNLKMFNNINMQNVRDKHKAEEYNIIGLANYINSQKKKYKENINDSKQKDFQEWSIDLHDKFALPITTIVFALIGIPLAITPPRAKANRGFLFTIMVIFFYYLIKAFSVSLGQASILLPFFAAWLPNIIIGVAGVFLFNKKAFKI